MEETFTSRKKENIGVLLEHARNRRGSSPEGSTFMPSENYAVELHEQANDKQEFILFLHFCSERLDKGETVQAIWHDYLEIIAQKLK